MPRHDVVVVGGGFAGMRAALAAKTAGANVALVSKTHPLRSHSSGSHSGINAALKDGDSWERHAQDTVVAGDYLGDQQAVATLCQEGIGDVIALEHMGVIFNRDGQGRIDVIPFAGASRPRTCFVGDSAGHIILQVLYEQMLRAQVPIYEEWLVTTLLIEDGASRGVIARELKSGQLHPIHARVVILATGGLGRLYEPSTAALTSTGDGVALAYRAGVPLMDMEMVQYHPTTLAGRGILITETARSEGARLVNKDGDRFMASYAPQAMEMVTRDLCSRAIAREISEGRGVDGNVLLDFRHLDEKRLADRLRETRWLVKDLTGIDLAKEPVPVRPAMHRPIGGIETDLNGATSLPGLYAAGECACNGAHGANRLGGNSLLDCIVFGRRAGEAAASHANTTSPPKDSQSQVADEENRIQRMAAQDRGADTPGALRRELARTMHEKVGLLRDASGLTSAAETVTSLKERHSRLGLRQKGGAFNADLSMVLELGNMLDTSEVMIASALARQESRGCHYRTDFPKRDDNQWLKHTIAHRGPDGPQLSYRPVVVTQWQPAERR